jgi:hypothetical protein
MSVVTESVPAIFATAARALDAVPPQTTPGVWRTYFTGAA